MPKRKRPVYEKDPDRVLQAKKQEVIDKITHSKKLLHKALKTAKGFERQKLGKRQKNAIDSGKHEDVRRINREIEALKALDLDHTTEAHLQKSLLKVKAIAESELLPEDIKKELEKPRSGEEERKAWQNVVSGMLGMKQVKDTMTQVIAGMHAVLGIPISTPVKGKKVNEPVRGILKTRDIEVRTEGEGEMDSSWDGFTSEEKDASKPEPEESGDEDADTRESDEELDEEEVISRYDALLGGSSDEESFDEQLYKAKRRTQPQARFSLSLSPSPSRSPSPSASQAASPTPPPQKAAKPKASKTAPAPIKASTFLPSLMGGYWSGSESSASDLEDDAVTALPVKKNRKGQMARRAIWEKKFKDNARHIKEGLGPVGRGKDDGWDAKLGAVQGGGRGRGRGGARGGGRFGSAGRDRAGVTGENSIPVGVKRGRGLGKKDDAGPLHPSWQAAKKAKTEQKTATFVGKKVVFD